MTGLQEFGIYMNKLLTIDALFLNEDRHTHNIAVLMNGKGDYAYCPILIMEQDYWQIQLWIILCREMFIRLWIMSSQKQYVANLMNN